MSTEFSTFFDLILMVLIRCWSASLDADVDDDDASFNVGDLARILLSLAGSRMTSIFSTWTPLPTTLLLLQQKGLNFASGPANLTYFSEEKTFCRSTNEIFFFEIGRKSEFGVMACETEAVAVSRNSKPSSDVLAPN